MILNLLYFLTTIMLLFQNDFALNILLNYRICCGAAFPAYFITFKLHNQTFPAELTQVPMDFAISFSAAGQGTNIKCVNDAWVGGLFFKLICLPLKDKLV